MPNTIQKDGMTRQSKNQTLKLGPAQDLSWPWWQSENNYEMMLEYECFCTFCKMFSWRQFVPLFDNCSNGGMEAWEVGSKKSLTHLR